MFYNNNNNNFKMICIPVFSPCKRNGDNQNNQSCGKHNNWNSLDFYGSITYRNNRQNNYFGNSNYLDTNNNFGGCGGCGNNYPEPWGNYGYNQFNNYQNQFDF